MQSKFLKVVMEEIELWLLNLINRLPITAELQYGTEEYKTQLLLHMA